MPHGRRYLILLGTGVTGSCAGAHSSNGSRLHSAICRAISAGSADTIVAYGDASFSSSSGRGNPSTPTVSLRRTLGYHYKVFDTDEFRTSRLCCACNTPMGGMPLPVTGDFLPYAVAAPLCLLTPLW